MCKNKEVLHEKKQDIHNLSTNCGQCYVNLWIKIMGRIKKHEGKKTFMLD
jgi:hypothetical protein